jgi:hypothetical protein
MNVDRPERDNAPDRFLPLVRGETIWESYSRYQTAAEVAKAIRDIELIHKIGVRAFLGK